ncbi:MAG: peptidoglycan-binding protein LysM [Gammaproteobacteria bacterium]
MSLFGFVKDIGRKIFNKDEEAAEEIKSYIESNNPGVENLEVTFDNGIVGLCGDCNSGEAFQKTVLMAGNVKGVIDVYTSGLKVVQNGQETPMSAAGDNQSMPDDGTKVEFYTIVSGDSLSKIAKHYYGNAMDYPKIFEANREVIEDPDKIYPGQKIRIPL